MEQPEGERVARKMLALETVVGRELALEVKVVNVIVALEAKVVTAEDGRVVNVIVALEAKVELYQPVKAGDCFWNIGRDNKDGDTLSILLTKQNQKEWWKSMIKGDPEVDLRNMKPSKLPDLDPEIRQTIEKIIIEHHRRAMGLATSDEIQQEDLLQDLLAQATCNWYTGLRALTTAFLAAQGGFGIARQWTNITSAKVG
ncbi:hypothetical protein E2562_031263 [Oryza meyeriana var. granulata]|uniref:CS domain-containing protein n=1 Tax=Oryza meyeriana var. granulata TaxID=110450 RepID=A0A6G1FE52_9ORYZ|nr:hypothetical protein E2562_031263 [Oryza meyeriana var. granulata]